MDLTLREFLRDTYAPLKGITDRTCELYEFTIRPFSKFLGHDATLADLNELAVARFLSSRSKTRSPATAAKDRAQLRAMWEMAARRGLVTTWPTMPRIVVPERVPEAWLAAEMTTLIQSAAQERGWVADIPAADWWQCAFLLGYETGERVRALMQLRWAQVRGRDVIFRAETRKGRARDILREISEHTAQRLEGIRGRRGPEDYVLPWHTSTANLYARFSKILKRAGLPDNRKSKFHKIRKTTASYYEAAGGSAQRLLDHSSAAVTRKYLDPRIVKQAAAPDIIPKVG